MSVMPRYDLIFEQPIERAARSWLFPVLILLLVLLAMFLFFRGRRK